MQEEQLAAELLAAERKFKELDASNRAELSVPCTPPLQPM